MNDYFVIRKEGTSPRILALTLNQKAQNLLNQEFDKAKVNFLNKFINEKREEDGRKIKEKVAYPLEISEYYIGYESSNELSVIYDYSLDFDMFDAVKNPTNITKFDTSHHSFENILAIFTADDDGRVLVQYYNSANVIKMSKSLFMVESSKEMTTGDEITGFTIQDNLIAILEENEDKFNIVFKNFNMAKRVFKNLNAYFEEASIPMLKEFSAKCFDTSGNFNILDIANNETRQKLAIINHSGILTNQVIKKDENGIEIKDEHDNPIFETQDKTPVEIQELAKKFDVDLQLNSDQSKIIPPDNRKALNDLLSGFCSLIYESPVTGQRMKANAAKPYPKK